MRLKINGSTLIIFYKRKKFVFKRINKWNTQNKCCYGSYENIGMAYSCFNIYICPRHLSLSSEIMELSGYKAVEVLPTTTFSPMVLNCVLCFEKTRYSICFKCLKEIQKTISDSPDKLRLLDGSES